MAKNVGGYNDLIDLFIEFRDLIKPNVKNGVPDFTKSAMEKQFDNLKILQDRFSKIDFYSWNIKQKVDYYVLRSENTRTTKIRTLISYVIMIVIMIGLLSVVNTVYGNIILVDFDRFVNSFADFSSQMRYDSFLLVMILPVTIGLFFTARKGLRHADSMLFFIPSLLLFGSLLALITDSYVTLPYRFIPFIAFFSISTSLIIFNNTKTTE